MSIPPAPTGRGSLSWRPDRPYDSLPALPDPRAVESRRIWRACADARAALAGLDHVARLLPDPETLISTVPLLESRASSEIENVVTTADALYRHLGVDAAADPATKEALRYRRALLDGFATLDSIPTSTRLAEAVCSRIKGQEMRVRRVPGTVIAEAATGRVIDTPPEGEDRLRAMLGDWESFVHQRDESDPLVRMAMAHYQFEAIHPFSDGNGRTGRILNVLQLVDRGLLELPILYLSRHFLAHRSRYYELLLAVTATGAWEEWLVFVLEGVEETSLWTRDKVLAVHALQEHTNAFVAARHPRLPLHTVLPVLFRKPYCRIADLVATQAMGRQTASRHLHTLVEAGVLEEQVAGREKLFVHRQLLDLLTREDHGFPLYGDRAGLPR